MYKKLWCTCKNIVLIINSYFWGSHYHSWYNDIYTYVLDYEWSLFFLVRGPQNASRSSTRSLHLCTPLTKSEEKERLLAVYICLYVPTLFSINSFVVYKFHRKPFCCCLSVISWSISTHVYNVAMSKNLVVDIGRELFLEENFKKIAKTKLNKDNVLEATAIGPKI